MNTFNNINSGETGHSVRGKLNQVLSEITGGSEGINAIWNRLDSLHQYINAMDGGVGGLIKDTSYDPSSLDPHKSITLIALGPGTFSNLKDAWGRPIKIVEVNSFTIFFREAGTDYWQYATTVISPSVEATLSNLFDETADSVQMTKDGKPIHPVTKTDLVFSPDGENLKNTLLDLRSVAMGTVDVRAVDSLWKETGIYSITAEPVTEGSPTTSIGLLFVFHDSFGAYCYQRLMGNYENPNNGFVGGNSSVTWDKTWLRKAPLNSQLVSRGDWSSWEVYSGILQQKTGSDTTSAMSQKAVTDELAKKQDTLRGYEETTKNDNVIEAKIECEHEFSEDGVGHYHIDRVSVGKDRCVEVASYDDEQGEYSEIIVKPTGVVVDSYAKVDIETNQLNLPNADRINIGGTPLGEQFEKIKELADRIAALENKQ